MDEQRKRAILDEARANLECLAGIEQRAAIEPEPEPWYMRAPATIRSRRAASAGSTRLRRRTGTPSISASPRRSLSRPSASPLLKSASPCWMSASTSWLPTARPELTLPTVYSAPGECPLASGFALAPFPENPDVT
jgi:hypothetical protein